MEIIWMMRRYLLPSVLIAAVLFAVWKGLYVLTIRILQKRKVSVQLKSWVFQYIFLVYLVGVLFVTEGIELFTGGIASGFMAPNLIPFVDTFRALAESPANMAVQIVYNISLFLPFGFFLPLAFDGVRWDWKKALLWSLITVFLVEGLEFLIGRYFDIDDLFINTAGSMLGYCLCWAVKKLARRRKNMETA